MKKNKQSPAAWPLMKNELMQGDKINFATAIKLWIVFFVMFGLIAVGDIIREGLKSNVSIFMSIIELSWFTSMIVLSMYIGIFSERYLRINHLLGIVLFILINITLVLVLLSAKLEVFYEYFKACIIMIVVLLGIMKYKKWPIILKR
jgi:hypothetical protein